MQTWNDLFVATAGAAAALAGLIFVGISINLQTILAYARLPERALMPIVLLVSVILFSIVFLIPNQPMQRLAIEVMVIAAVTWLIVSYINFLILKDVNAEYKLVSIRSCVIDQLATLPYLIASYKLMHLMHIGYYFIVLGFMLSIIKAILDAWILIIEIKR